MLEVYYNFFKKICDTGKYEELEKDTASLYLALSEEILEDVIVPKKRVEWNQLRSEDCTDILLLIKPVSFSAELAVMPKRNMIRESRVSSKKSLDVQKCCGFVAKHFVVSINRLTSTSTSKGINKRRLDDCGDGPISKYRKVLEEFVNVTSTRRGCRAIERSVATFEQTKKRLSYFYPKK